ncbi:hypothetical protein DSO57_1005206 [Entomophthora muscae]|uniref:Uncharacterized protein n=1 Tax=Entomophthora muscae TaxID=34485 RepID=A0ACC2T800_9FUNG|nr:hypothetical protein DSO57_1005206 [Entomophthora muscae]
MDSFSYHTRILITCNYIFNVASTLCGALTVLVILGAMFIDRRAMDRLSIRFTLAIAALDAVKALTILFYTEFHEDGPACTFISLFLHWQTLFYLFLNVCISLNLQLVFIHGLLLGKPFEVFMWIAALSMSTILMLIGLTTGKYGMDQEINQCEIRDPFSTHSLVVLWTTFLFWALLACAYCFVVVVWTIINLILKISALKTLPSGVSRRRHQEVMDANAKIQQKIRQLIWRIALYCIIPVLTQSGYLALRVISTYALDAPLPLFYISCIGSSKPLINNG